MVSVVSFSGGKDSTAMLHLLLGQGIKSDFVIMFETEWEFPQIWEHVRAVEEKTGLKVTRLRYYRRFDDLLEWYGWPGYRGGWCTGRKQDTCHKFIRAIGATTEFLGFAANEKKRAEGKGLQKKKWEVRFPLIEAGMSEEDSLRFCLDLGYDFGGLYNIFNRVSCFCCPNAGKKRREVIRKEFPELWEEWLRKDALAKQRLIEKCRRTT